MANEDEVADILAAMQESVRRSWQKTSESESGPLKYFQMLIRFTNFRSSY